MEIINLLNGVKKEVDRLQKNQIEKPVMDIPIISTGSFSKNPDPVFLISQVQKEVEGLYLKLIDAQNKLLNDREY